MKVKFTPTARRQFLDAIAYIRRDKPSVAVSFRQVAKEKLKRLERFPGIVIVARPGKLANGIELVAQRVVVPEGIQKRFETVFPVLAQGLFFAFGIGWGGETGSCIGAGPPFIAGSGE